MPLLASLLLLSLITLAAVALPLLRRARATPQRAEFDRAVYRDQLKEVERDLARGVLSENEAHSARLEIQRRLLATDEAPSGRSLRLERSPVLAGIIALIVVGGSIGLYARLGAPSVPDEPFAERKLDTGSDVAGGHADMRQAASRLAERLAREPNDTQSWLLFGRTEAMLGEWSKAAQAFHHAIDLGAKGADVFASYGEMQVMQTQGIVSPAAHDAFVSALKDDPKNDVARYYLALAAGQAGEAQKAIELLQGLAADLPDDSPMREEIGKRVAEAAKAAGQPVPTLAKGTPPPVANGPNADDMAAAANMPEAERKEMIRSMVAGLAARLQTQPDDLDGWMKLGRAYTVLGEADKSVDAYGHAEKLRPGDVEILLREAQALLEGLQPSDPLPARAVALMRQVETVSPNQPEALWYLGVDAARSGNAEAARGYWTRLLSVLPADGEDAKLVKSALDVVKGK